MPLTPRHRPQRPVATALPSRRCPRHATPAVVIALLLAFASGSVCAQDALRLPLASDQAALLRQRQLENLPYTYRLGDLKVLVGGSTTAEWNDNVNLSRDHAQNDFILKPLLTLDARYPIASRNFLRLNLDIGWDQYLDHDEYSDLRIKSGSEIAFDMYIQDFWINFHDRFKFIRDPAEEAGLANSGRYGGFYNVAGVTGTWDLHDLIPTLGYDHQNFISAESEYEYLNRATELLLSRAGFQIDPRLIAGIETTGSFTAYDEPILNDNTGFSAGAYADWHPGSAFRLQPRAGYAAYFFDQTSRNLLAADVNAWYADLTVSHQITEAISYSLSVGHEVRLGIDADAIEDTCVRPSLTWRMMKYLSLTPYLSYQNGVQGQGTGGNAGRIQETFEWFGDGVSLNYEFTRRFSAGLSYRGTVRSSNLPSRDYAQNLVAIRFHYVIR